MPRCEQTSLYVVGVQPGATFPGVIDVPVHWEQCPRSADAVVIVRHLPMPLQPGERSKWRLCAQHAAEMQEPGAGAPGDRVKVIPLTERGRTMVRSKA